MEIILGKEGHQPFEIKQSGVSRKHATITVDNNGHYVLEDLGSTNGTYVRGEDGELRQVAKVEITPMTFICLGPNNANGCSFYAKRAIDNGSYTEEFEYLYNLDQRFDEEEESNDNNASNMRMVISVASLIALAGSFIATGSLQIMLLRLGTIVSLVSSVIYNPNKKKKSLKAKREKFYDCPNPECSHKLTSREIKNMQCSRCKAK